MAANRFNAVLVVVGAMVAVLLIAWGGLYAVRRARIPPPLPPGLCDVTVQVTAIAIFVDGARVAPASSDGGDDVIAPLALELKARGRTCLVLQAEPVVSYELIKSVMTTARSAGYADIRFSTL
ncbi:MAG: hypothetical protein QM817_12215 [Archangium sp.]